MSVLAIAPGNILSFSSFGADNTTVGSFRGKEVLDGERFHALDRLQSYFDCTQHNHKRFDFDGRVYNPTVGNPLLGAEKASFYVPLMMRRPSSPARLGRLITRSFTNLLFGEQRFPRIGVDGDSDSEDFLQTIARVGKLPLRMIRARDLGGAMGTVGLSWSFVEGRPRFEVHNAKHLFVHSWEDRAALVPRHVTETYLFYKVKWDGKGFNPFFYWYRRDWTPDWDIVWRDVPVLKNEDPLWVPDMARSKEHKDGRTHFEWIQNLPTENIDGAPDCYGLYDQLDSYDILSSVVKRGATLNLDPTLVLKLDPELINRAGVRKGSDNALIVGKDGDASYLELGGESLTAGKDLLEHFRRQILEAALCIIPDPADVAAQGVSSVAVKAMFAPMIGQADVLREQYGTAIERMLADIQTIAIKASKSREVFVDPITGDEVEGIAGFNLPPRVETHPPEPEPPDPAEDGEPEVDPETGLPVQKDPFAPADPDVDPAAPPVPEEEPEDVVEKIPRKPGEGGEVNLKWPPYFPPTPDDQTKTVTNMQMATGGKAFLSKETATEITAQAFGIDPVEEQKRIDKQGVKDKADAKAMMPPGIGGEVPGKDDLPPGANPRAGGKPPPFGKHPFGGADPDAPEDEGLNPEA